MDFLRYSGLALLVIGAIVFFVTSRRLWSAVDTPTLASGHVTIGRIEVTGTAAPAPGHTPIVSPLSLTTCAWFKAEVQQETGGKEKSWKTRHTATSAPAMVVDDGSGPVLVNLTGVTPSSPASSTVSARELPALLCGADLDVIAGGHAYMPNAQRATSPSLLSRLAADVFATWDDDRPIAELGGKWRVVESRIEVGSDVYVLGSTLYDDTTHTVRFEKQASKPLFVYNGKQSELIRNSRRVVIGAALAMVVGTFLTGAAWKSLGVDPNRRLNVGAGLFLLAPLGCLVLSIQLVRIRNRITATANQVKAGEGLVDIALAKRATLIPNLVSVVQAAVGHTETVLERLTALRSSAAPGSGELNDLGVVAERYPQLGTSENFLQLQRNLSAVETDLAVASGFVVDARAAHRTRIESFPDSLVAKMFGLEA